MRENADRVNETDLYLLSVWLLVIEGAGQQQGGVISLLARRISAFQ